MMRLFAAASLLVLGMSARADDPPAEPEKEVDVAKTTERVVDDAKDAGKRLADKDPGSDTQQLQQNILKNIDELLRKANQPPPPSGGGNSSSSNGGMGSSSKQHPMGGSSSSSAQRKERREKSNGMAKADSRPKPQPLDQGADQQRNLGGGNGSPNKMPPKENSQPPRLPDAYKDVWGQLQDKNREEMARYYREYFDPRYTELLDQYYSSLAERAAKKKP